MEGETHQYFNLLPLPLTHRVNAAAFLWLRLLLSTREPLGTGGPLGTVAG